MKQPSPWKHRAMKREWTKRDMLKILQGQYDSKCKEPVKISLPKFPWENTNQKGA